MKELTTGVMIVGAGPTGLMLAACLQRLGVPHLIADLKHGPTRESRALALQARSLEIYAQIGLEDRVLGEATAAPAIVLGFQDRPFAIFRFQGPGEGVTPYPGLYVLEQSRNERLLVDALEERGGGVLWGHRLRAVESRRQDAVTAVFDDDGGTAVRVTARFLVGADGASSTVRELTGIPFDGRTNPLSFYVADARGVEGLVEDCVNLRFSATDFLLCFPQGSAGRHRLIGVVRTPTGETPTEEGTRRVLDREFGVHYRDSAWFSTYRVHHRVARSFRSGPVFLAGDAAHVHSPVGAQGMNTGLQDAHNLACAFADVFHRRSGDERLDRYEAERRPVAVRLVRTTDRLFGAVTTDSEAARVFRGTVLPRLAPVLGFLMPRLARGVRAFEYLSQIRIHYGMPDGVRHRDAGRVLGLVTGRRRRGPLVGRRLAWNGDNFRVLQAMEWQLHVYGDADPAALDRMRAESGLPVHHFVTVRNPALRPSSHGAGGAGQGLAVLIRPDSFVVEARPLPASVADWAVHGRRAPRPEDKPR